MGTSPQRLSTARTGLEDQLSGIFGNALNTANTPGAAKGGAPGMAAPGVGMRPGGTMANASAPRGKLNIPAVNDRANAAVGGGGAPGGGGGVSIQDFFNNLSIPQYGGPMTAGSNPLLEGAFASGRTSLGNLPGFADLAGDLTSGFRGFGSAPIAPDAVMSLLTNRPGAGILNELASGGGAAGDLLKLGRGGGAVGALLEQGGQSDRDFGGIISALDAARRGSLEDSLRDTQERFSSSGLRFSTDLANALGETSRRSEEGFLGQAAGLLPELTRQRTGALGTAGQLQLGALQGAGGLGLGAGETLQQGGIAAGDILGQLFQGQQGRALQALQSIPGAQDILGRLGLDTRRQAFDLGAAQRGMEQEGISALYNEFLRTQGGLLAPILNFASGAPQITGPGKGSQLMGLIS